MRFLNNLNRGLALTLALALFSAWMWAQQTLPAPVQPQEGPALASHQAPKLEFETMTHDFGKSIQGQNLKCVFKFKNTGTGVLDIVRVKGG